MLGRLLALWEQISNSLWLVPLVLLAAAVLLAATLVGVSPNPFEGPSDGTEAISLVSTLLSAMITVLAMVVSITMVVLSVAATQLGPRLIRLFIGDMRTQIGLGVFVATIGYLLLLLRGLDGDMPQAEVPHLAVNIAGLLSLGCVVALLLFVHHLARSIVADTIVHRVGDELDDAMLRLSPRAASAEEAEPHRPDGEGAAFSLCHGGYIQVIDYWALVACARAAGATITLDVRPGNHVLPGGIHGAVHPPTALTKRLTRRIDRAVVVGDVRTARQDLEFGLRQLVEIALRALSGGINDPFTAMLVIDRLTSSLTLMMTQPLGARVLRDKDDTVRVIAVTSDFAGLLDAAFNQIRQTSGGRVDILARLLESLGKLAPHVHNEDQRRVLALHLRMIGDLAWATVTEPHDLEALRARHEAAREGLYRQADELTHRG
ncbi:MAG: DUF2254 domain-containing protein [Alphaproteobacteria bacterium]|nr:DUF2254 domain-containing protein [Alphaproteobacteria bacterium]